MRPPSYQICVTFLAIAAVCGEGCDDGPSSGGGGTAGTETTSSSSSAGGETSVAAGGSGGQGAVSRVRVVAANLSSGNDQSYDGGHGIRILRGLDADLILLQEMSFGNDSPAAMDALVTEVCSDCTYTRGPGAAHPNGIPNGIMTRLPVVQSGHWVDPEVDNRSFVWARLDARGGHDLWAISVHLLSSNATSRNLEAQALLLAIENAIPESDFVVLGGDLNTNHRNELAINTLSSRFVTAGPYPRDQGGNDSTNAPRNRPYDWLLEDSELALRRGATTIGSQSFAAGAVIDTRVHMPLSDIAPAQLGDSGAVGMQHMAVVRDYVF